MFTEKFNEIINKLNIKSSYLAEASGVDRTYISHLKSGRRMPPSGSNTSIKLCGGVMRIANKSGDMPLLCEIIGIPENSPSDKISESLYSYLFSDVSTVKKSASGRKRADKKRFGMRFDISMDLAELSNVILGRMISVDASLISRYRSGDRILKYNSETAAQVKTILWERICKAEKTENLAGIIGISAESLDEEIFGQWLYDMGDEEKAAENVIDAFEAFSLSNDIGLPSFESICPDEIINDKREVYYGIDGIRHAVIRFLGEVIKSRAEKTYLFSDQGMEWMVDDPDFMMKWAAMMFMVVKNGTRITIIHNIDRGLDEMTSAIKSWLPLYISGMIEPYYCKKNTKGSFNHTLFLCPGHSCVESCHIHGAEDIAPYNYYTDEEHLNMYEKQYRLHLKDSGDLITFTETEDISSEEEMIVIDRNQIRIVICNKYVKIVYLQKPELPFYFRHPLMVRAFLSYAKEP